MARTPIIVNYDKVEEKGSIGTEWKDYSFKDYVNYLRALEKNSTGGVYEALTGVSQKMWSNPHKAELFFNIDKVLSFTNNEPSCEMPTHIELDEDYVEMEQDFMNLPLKEYRDMIEIVNTVVSVSDGEEVDNIKMIEIIPKLIAVFILKEYKDISEIDRKAERIEKMPADVVNTLGSFFLQKLTELKNGTKTTQSKRLSLKTSFKQVMVRLVAISVICITYIRYPRVIFWTLTRFFKKVWLRCTGGNSYRVASVPQTKSTGK